MIVETNGDGAFRQLARRIGADAHMSMEAALQVGHSDVALAVASTAVAVEVDAAAKLRRW